MWGYLLLLSLFRRFVVCLGFLVMWVYIFEIFFLNYLNVYFLKKVMIYVLVIFNSSIYFSMYCMYVYEIGGSLVYFLWNRYVCVGKIFIISWWCFFIGEGN